MGGFIVGLLFGTVMAFGICYKDLGKAYDAMAHSQARAVKAEREVERLVALQNARGRYEDTIAKITGHRMKLDG